MLEDVEAICDPHAAAFEGLRDVVVGVAARVAGLVEPSVRKVLVLGEDLVDDFVVFTERREDVLVGLLEVEADDLAPLQSSETVKYFKVFLFGQSFVSQDDDSSAEERVLLPDESVLLVDYPRNLGVVISLYHFSTL